jgi:hypothetical protein
MRTETSSKWHPRPLPPIDADLVLISRVLTDLLANAIRHSPKATPIRIHATLTDQDGIKVSITDHGRASAPIDATRSSNSSPGETMTPTLDLDSLSPRPSSKPTDSTSG